jgi:hypothetical protein
MRKHQIPNILIDGNNACRLNNNLCANNGRSVCYECQIFAGNLKLPVKFTPALKSLSNAVEQKIIVKLPPIKPEVKIVPPSEDNEDKPNFVNFLSGAITHLHAENMRIHKHFFCNQVGDRCVFCGAPIVGTTCCDLCNSLFEIENIISFGGFRSFNSTHLKAS